METIFYVIQFIFIEHYNKPGTQLLGTQRWIRSSPKSLTGGWGGVTYMHSRWRGHDLCWLGLGEEGWGEPLSRGDLWAGSWNMRFFLFISIKILKYEIFLFISNKISIGIRKKIHTRAWKRPGKPSAWLCTCCSGRYLQNCWLRLRGEQERVEDSQRNFVKYFFSLSFSILLNAFMALFLFTCLWYTVIIYEHCKLHQVKMHSHRKAGFFLFFFKP